MRAQVVQWEDDNEALLPAAVRDAFFSLSLPPISAGANAWAWAGASTRLVQWLRLWLPRLLVAGLALAALHPRAYDAEKMLVAAQKHGPRALAGARALQAALIAAGDSDEESKLGAVNQFFNRRIQ